MNNKDLELYFFNTYSLETVRNKYFPKLKEIVKSEDFFNNEDLSLDKRLEKRSYMENKIYKFILSDKSIEEEFSSAYGLCAVNILCEFVLQGLVADEAIKTNFDKNIFLNKCSIVCLDHKYPPNIRDWKKDKTMTLLKACAFENDLVELFNTVPLDDLFGQDLIKDIEEKIKDYEEKNKPKN